MVMLPEELLIEILTRLEGKQLVRCKCVCKSWLSTIRSPAFLAVYPNREPTLMVFWSDSVIGEKGLRLNCVYSILRRSKDAAYQLSLLKQIRGLKSYRILEKFKTEVVNGLVCVRESDLRLTIYNICTGQGMILPEPMPCSSPHDQQTNFFLGYDPVSRVYKLLRLIHSVQMEAEIMTVRPSNRLSTWRKLDNATCGISSLPDGYRFCALGTYGGFLWWWLRGGFLVCFDLNNEKFQRIKVPDHVNGEFIQSMGCPALLASPLVSDPGFFLLFVLENNVWAEHSVPFPEELGLMKGIVDAGNLPTGEILLMNVEELIHEDFLPADQIMLPVYSYNHRTNKSDRFLVGKLHKNESPFDRFGEWLRVMISRRSAKIWCMHHHSNNFYLPLDDVLSGVV